MRKYPVIFCDFKVCVFKVFPPICSDNSFTRSGISESPATLGGNRAAKSGGRVDDELVQIVLLSLPEIDQGVIVLIDEYEVPNLCAFEYGYFKEVRSPQYIPPYDC
jgi:hypothetical protein